MSRTIGAAEGSQRRLRKDAARNRQKLLDAAGELLRTAPKEASMPRIAKVAGVSTATAYRFFPSQEDLLNAYLHGVILRLRDFSHDCSSTGPALFDLVVEEWVRLLHDYGPAMVQLRSRTGLLARLHEGDPVISSVRDAWERPIRAVMRNMQVPDAQFDIALFLYNVLFDPREILDLLQLGIPETEIRHRLVAAYKGALQGWARSGG